MVLHKYKHSAFSWHNLLWCTPISCIKMSSLTITLFQESGKPPHNGGHYKEGTSVAVVDLIC